MVNHISECGAGSIAPRRKGSSKAWVAAGGAILPTRSQERGRKAKATEV
jgi:hypothetical protein